MDNPRITSPPSILVQNLTANNATQRPSRRASSQTSSKTPPKAALPMSIPNASIASAPPPLPPPRYLLELDAGHDPGWRWGNNGSMGRFGDSVSDYGSLKNSPRNWDKHEGLEMETDPLEERRRESIASIHKFKESGYKHSYNDRHKDEGYHSLSLSSSIAHQLQGERPLERRNLQETSHAYDKQQLSRIGKDKTPPRSSISASIDGSPVSLFSPPAKHSNQLKHLSPSERSHSTSSDSPFKASSSFSSKWTDSPQSAVVSPSLISTAASANSFLEHRSPTYDGHCKQVGGLTRMRQAGRRSDSDGSILVGGGLDHPDSAITKMMGRSKRGGSYDQSFLNSEPDLDSDFPIEETSGMRQLQLEDRNPPSIDVYSPDSRLGMKRRASSPLREAVHDDKAQAQIVGGSSSDLYQRRTSGHLSTSRASSINRFHPTHGSVSSTSSSGHHNGSYASSAGLSVGDSSITSISSSHDRLSPGGISPLSEYHDSRDPPYVASTSLDQQNPQSSVSRSQPGHKSSAAIARKMSTDNTGRGKQHSAPNLQSNMHICDCCPKKPKKFSTAEELHNHQLEKQYTCQFCHNRFKNKNEAERHQNSLHLRRHSWSCATLAGSYVAAFHHCTAIPPNTNTNSAPQPPSGLPGQTDICGYCGMEFPNDPAPDWDARINHLTTVHKFGECNQSKKFFRADHFRQHLKHSHAGTSGKWTNMLESACMKDEPPLTPEAQSQEQLRLQQQGAPVANMMGMGSASRQGSFGGMGMSMPGDGNNLQYQKIEEEIPEDM